MKCIIDKAIKIGYRRWWNDKKHPCKTNVKFSYYVKFYFNYYSKLCHFQVIWNDMRITLRETKIGLKAFSKCLNSVH
jgi:hypothetical protein